MRLTRDGEVTIVSRSVTVNGRPTGVTFDFTPSSPLAGEAVAVQRSRPATLRTMPSRSHGPSGTVRTATGRAPPRLRRGGHIHGEPSRPPTRTGATGRVTRQIVVRPDRGPTASFDFSPTVPDVGETVTFTSTREASQGSIDGLGLGSRRRRRVRRLQWSRGQLGVRLPGRAHGSAAGPADQRQVGTCERRVRVNGLPSGRFHVEPAPARSPASRSSSSRRARTSRVRSRRSAGTSTVMASSVTAARRGSASRSRRRARTTSGFG